MCLELAHVADPPDVVADAVGLPRISRLISGRYFLAEFDRFEHRAVAVAAAANVVDLAGARRANEARTHQPGRRCECCRAPAFPCTEDPYGRPVTVQFIR